MPEKRVGTVEHYYPKVRAAAVRLSGDVKLGDQVHIVGHGDDVREKVTSMQLDHTPINEGHAGQSIGLWVKDRVHEGDEVLLVTDGGKPAATKAKPKPKKAAKKAKAKPKRKAAKKGKKKLSKKQVAQRKYASGMKKIRSRAKKAKGGKGRIAKRGAAKKLRKKLKVKGR